MHFLTPFQCSICLRIPIRFSWARIIGKGDITKCRQHWFFFQSPQLNICLAICFTTNMFGVFFNSKTIWLKREWQAHPDMSKLNIWCRLWKFAWEVNQNNLGGYNPFHKFWINCISAYAFVLLVQGHLIIKHVLVLQRRTTDLCPISGNFGISLFLHSIPSILFA